MEKVVVGASEEEVAKAGGIPLARNARLAVATNLRMVVAYRSGVLDFVSMRTE